MVPSTQSVTALQFPNSTFQNSNISALCQNQKGASKYQGYLIHLGLLTSVFLKYSLHTNILLVFSSYRKLSTRDEHHHNVICDPDRHCMQGGSCGASLEGFRDYLHKVSLSLLWCLTGWGCMSNVIFMHVQNITMAQHFLVHAHLSKR